MKYSSLIKLIETEVSNYDTQPIPLADNWEWNMKEHIRRCFLLKNSKFTKGKNDFNRPFRNIILPIVNVAYRSEGFDVKDIVPFVNDINQDHKSFLVKKYHPRFARKNDLDTFIDEIVESYTDYGLALIKDIDGVRPEVVPLMRLAFCDQTEVLNGPLAERHFFSIGELEKMRGKWDSDKIDSAIAYATTGKAVSLANGNTAHTPGKNLEIYEVHGELPESWLAKGDEDEDYLDANKFVQQVQMVTFFMNELNQKEPLVLYSGREKPGLYKRLKRDDIWGRACGRSGIEELFDPQIWGNYGEIKIKALLDAAAIAVIKTTDKKFAEKNKLNDLEVGQVLEIDDGKDATTMTFPMNNQQIFEAKVVAWENHARTLGSASDASLGINPASGTPFKLQDLIVREGQGMHDYRRGKIATFIGEIYRDMILEDLVKDMNQGQKFFEQLSPEELQYVLDRIITNTTNRKIKDEMLSGRKAKLMTPEEVTAFRELATTQFLRGGKKQLLEAVKGELKDLPIDVEINVAGKQKNLAGNADKLTNIFRTIIAAPQVFQIPGMGKLFNEIIESSGFSPVDFAGIIAQPVQQPLEKQKLELPAEKVPQLA